MSHKRYYVKQYVKLLILLTLYDRAACDNARPVLNYATSVRRPPNIVRRVLNRVRATIQHLFGKVSNNLADYVET